MDRLSRSLADFTQLMTRFDANGIRFVSITQHFNTASSMGKLTLNMLLSFAQFEREVTAERISDKLYASKKKSLWTGGRPPLGYDVKAHQLVINAAEAKVVKSIFQYYVQCGSLRQLLTHHNQNNITNKSWVNKQGNAVVGKPFCHNSLSLLLKRRLYIGEIDYKVTARPNASSINDQILR